MSRMHSLLLALLFITFVPFAFAQESDPKPAADKPVQPAAEATAENTDATAGNIARWIKELDSEDFAVRQQATAKLVAAGRAVIEPVAKAAEGESLEVTTRCMEVLAKLYAAKDAETKAAAQKALETLVNSKNTSAARRARDLLKIETPDAAAAVDPAAPPGPFGVPGPFGGRIEIGGIGIGGGGAKVSIRVTDGAKTIEAAEGDTKVKIEEDAKGAIKMEVIEKVDGKEKSSKYEAKSAAELKKNHADAHKLYEKYAKFGGAGVIGFGGGFGGGILMPPAMPALPMPPGFGGGKFRMGIIPQKALDQLEQARKQLDEATAQMKKLAGESRIEPERIKKLAEQIDEAKKQLEEAQKQLGK